MSYDLRIKVKVDGTDIYAVIAEPEYSEPTYNLGKMFRACMDWDFQQGEIYNCKFAIDKIQHGIRQLRTNRKAYKKFESPNGWGDIDNAIEVLQSLRDCIYEQVEYIPIQHLYMSW